MSFEIKIKDLVKKAEHKGALNATNFVRNRLNDDSSIPSEIRHKVFTYLDWADKSVEYEATGSIS